MYIVKIHQTGASAKLDAKTLRGAKREATQWQSMTDRQYPMHLFTDGTDYGFGDIVAVKDAYGKWRDI